MQLTTMVNWHRLKRRIRAYGEVKRLAREGFSTSQIARITNVDDATVRGWLLEGRKPWTVYKLFSPEPSEDLSYVIGVYAGDGSISRWRGGAMLRLQVKDHQFAAKFGQACGRILRRHSYVPTLSKRGRFEISVANTSLCDFIEQGPYKLRTFIESHPTGFVRGLADSDGCPAITTTYKRGKPWFFVQVVVATSPDTRLLAFCRKILSCHFGIYSTFVNKGAPGPRVFNGQLFNSSKRIFDLRISRFDDLKRFSSQIGFGLERKQAKLEHAIKVRARLGTGAAAVSEWMSEWAHTKNQREWTLKSSSLPNLQE